MPYTATGFAAVQRTHTGVAINRICASPSCERWQAQPRHVAGGLQVTTCPAVFSESMLLHGSRPVKQPHNVRFCMTSQELLRSDAHSIDNNLCHHCTIGCYTCLYPTKLHTQHAHANAHSHQHPQHHTTQHPGTPHHHHNRYDMRCRPWRLLYYTNAC